MRARGGLPRPVDFRHGYRSSGIGRDTMDLRRIVRQGTLTSVPAAMCGQQVARQVSSPTFA